MQFDVKTNWARPFLHSILFLSCCFVNGALQEDLMLKLVDPPGGTPLIRLRSPSAHLNRVLHKWKRYQPLNLPFAREGRSFRLFAVQRNFINNLFFDIIGYGPLDSRDPQCSGGRRISGSAIGHARAFCQ